MNIKESINVAQKLQQCAQKSCKEFDIMKKTIRSQYNENVKQIEGLLKKDFKEWNKQRAKLEKQMHKSLDASYKCIIKKCDREVRELIKLELKENEQIINDLKILLTKEHVKKSKEHTQLVLKRISSLKKEMQVTQQVLKSAHLDIKKVVDHIKYF